ncbi:MAG: aminotransferase class I/II-fold pyridoxal phosphate-dependent enzyme [Bacteroidota bacterium]
MNIQSLNGRQVCIQGQEYLYFGGTSYLAMHTHPLFQVWIKEGFDRYGSNYGGSRRSNLQFEVIAQAEEQLAQLTGQEAALTFSSGTLAAQALIQSLAQTHQLLYARGAHPALWQTHITNHPSDFRIDNLIKQVHQSPRSVAIICNGIDPLQVKAYDFSWWQELPKDRSTAIVLDESHALGIVGQNGGGNSELWQVPEQVELIITSSLAKAFGVPGGVVIGRKERIRDLENSALFGGASPITPAYLFAFSKARKLYGQQLRKLRARIRQLQEYNALKSLPNYPVFKVDNQPIVDQLKAANILISSFAYPMKESPLLNRIVLNAAHERSDIDRLMELLEGE